MEKQKSSKYGKHQFNGYCYEKNKKNNILDIYFEKPYVQEHVCQHMGQGKHICYIKVNKQVIVENSLLNRQKIEAYPLFVKDKTIHDY